MERLPGRPLSEMGGVDYDFVLGQIGDFLAQTHRIQVDQYGYLGAHRPMEAMPTWAGAFAHMWNRLIDDIVDVGHYDDAESGMMRTLLDRRLGVFDRPVATPSSPHTPGKHHGLLRAGRSRISGTGRAGGG